MALSMDEQRMLAEIERRLAADAPGPPPPSELAFLARESSVRGVTGWFNCPLSHRDYCLGEGGVPRALVVPAAPGRPYSLARHARRAHVDRHVAAQVQAGLALLLPGI